MAERARLQPLARMNLTQGSACVRKPKFSAFNTMDRGHIVHTPSSFIFSIFPIATYTQMENFKLEDPWRHPHKLVSRWGSHSPTDGSTLSLGSRGKELAPRGKNEANNHHATMATHPSLFFKVRVSWPPSQPNNHHHHQS